VLMMIVCMHPSMLNIGTCLQKRKEKEMAVFIALATNATAQPVGQVGAPAVEKPRGRAPAEWSRTTCWSCSSPPLTLLRSGPFGYGVAGVKIILSRCLDHKSGDHNI
jgi:hypothetical protein